MARRSAAAPGIVAVWTRVAVIVVAFAVALCSHTDAHGADVALDAASNDARIDARPTARASVASRDQWSGDVQSPNVSRSTGSSSGAAEHHHRCARWTRRTTIL